MSRRQFLPSTCEWSSSITARSRTVDSERGVRHRGLVVRHRTLCCAQNIVGTKGTKRGPAAQCGKTWWTRNSPKPGWSPQSAVRPPGHQNTTGARSQRHRELAKGGVEVKGAGPAAAHNTLRQRRLAGCSGILKGEEAAEEERHTASLPVPISLAAQATPQSAEGVGPLSYFVLLGSRRGEGKGEVLGKVWDSRRVTG